MKNKIVVFTRDCGDKSDYSTQISILRVSDKLDNESGNIVIASINLGNMLPSNIGSVINSRWATNNNVVIQYHEKVGICKNEKEYEGIKITYDILK
jgi:hypothetical protein